MTIADHQLVPRGTALLLAVLGVLAGYLWLFELAPLERPAFRAEGAALLPVPAAVARIELEERDRILTAVRAGDGWRDPRGRPWRDDAITDLVTTLGSLEPLMVVDAAPHAPADYGLGDGASRLALADAAGHGLLALEIGERNPAWTGLYVRHADRPEVMLVGAVLGWELDKLRKGAPDSLTMEPKTHETAGGARRAVQPRRDR